MTKQKKQNTGLSQYITAAYDTGPTKRSSEFGERGLGSIEQPIEDWPFTQIDIFEKEA